MDQMSVGGVPIPERPDTGEPPIGSVVVDGVHVFLRRSDGSWYGCITCGDEDLEWSWEEVRADIEAWRVVEP